MRPCTCPSRLSRKWEEPCRARPSVSTYKFCTFCTERPWRSALQPVYMRLSSARKPPNETADSCKFAASAARLVGSHQIESVIHLGDNMETIEDVACLRAVLLDE